MGFILLMVFLPNTKFKSKKQKWGIIGSFACLAIIIATLMVWLMLSSYMNNVYMAGDSRGGNTSLSEQLGVILQHPFIYIQLMFKEIKGAVGRIFVGEIFICEFLLP